jgi:glycosyltransferase involved in cell wall biosynthesis
VTILCSQKGNDYDLDKDLRINEIKPWRMRRLGYDFRNLSHNLPLYRAARRLVENEKIEAVYERFSLYSVVGTWLTRRYRLPRIVEVNAFLTVEHRGKIYFPFLARRVEKYIVRRAPALVVVSQPLFDSLVRLGVPRERISIMPMAVDVTHFKPDRERGEAIRRKWRLDSRLVIGYIGSLSGWHGISLLHDMAAEILKHRKDFVIFVVGGEEHQAERHRRRARANGLGDYLLFAGSVPYSEVPNYINAMDMALVPDTNYWTCPTKMFEYQASGVPTIAPKYAAILRGIDHGEEGLLFEPRNIPEAVEQILKLAADPSLRETIGRKARLRVMNTHSWQHNIGRIINLFESMRTDVKTS